MEMSAPIYKKRVNLGVSVTSELDKFFDQYPTQYFDKNHIFLFPGERPVGVNYVSKGYVRVFDITKNGNEVVVNIFTPKSIFPMSKILNKTQNHYFYQAGTPLRMKVAPTTDFLAFLQLNPSISIDLLSKSYLSAQTMRRRMAHLMGGSAYSRLIYELVLQAYNYGVKKSADTYIIDINEAEIGARAGLSRETVSREFKSLKKQGLLSVSKGKIKINSMEKLESILGANL